LVLFISKFSVRPCAPMVIGFFLPPQVFLGAPPVGRGPSPPPAGFFSWPLAMPPFAPRNVTWPGPALAIGKLIKSKIPVFRFRTHRTNQHRTAPRFFSSAGFAVEPPFFFFKQGKTPPRFFPPPWCPSQRFSRAFRDRGQPLGFPAFHPVKTIPFSNFFTQSTLLPGSPPGARTHVFLETPVP